MKGGAGMGGPAGGAYAVSAAKVLDVQATMQEACDSTFQVALCRHCVWCYHGTKGEPVAA